MNVRSALVAQGFLCALLGLTLLLGAGCKTAPPVDWNSRIGNYTYDQAVAELGPPDKTAQLSDGRTVADWIVHQSGGSAVGFGTGFYGGHMGVGVGQTIVTGNSDKVLRLTFDADHRLAAWSKNY